MGWWVGGFVGQCDFSVSPGPFGLEFGTLDFGTLDLGLTIIELNIAQRHITNHCEIVKKHEPT